MNILAMAIASTFNSQRKYLRWHLKPTAFFWGCLVLGFLLVGKPNLCGNKKQYGVTANHPTSPTFPVILV